MTMKLFEANTDRNNDTKLQIATCFLECMTSNQDVQSLISQRQVFISKHEFKNVLD